jgi:hypothetical protein
MLCLSALIMVPTFAVAEGGDSDVKENVVVKKNVESKGKEVVQDNKTTFEAKKGERLSDVIIRWSESEGWKVHWAYSEDYILPVDVSIRGNLKDTLEMVSQSLTDSSIDVKIQMFTKNKAILVK